MLNRRSYIAINLSLLASAANPLISFEYARAAADEHDILSRERVWNDPDIPALGNPKGDITLVEYFDYQCPICRAVHPDLSRVIREDAKVRLVSKSWPIFGDASIYAAQIALAAKYQSKFAEAHEALFAAKVALRQNVVHGILAKAGVDVAKAAADLDANRTAIDSVLARNQRQAVAFGFLGTPGFIIGTFRVNGGLEATGFRQVIAAARAAQVKSP
jgi:protein-disulfide isomerase